MGISSSQGVKVDDSAFQAHLRDFAKVMGKSMAEVIVMQAGLFCVDMASASLPLQNKNDKNSGLTPAAREKGQDSVRRSVFKLFQPVSGATTEQIAAVGRQDVFKMWEKRNSAIGIAGTSKKVRWRQFQQKYGGGSGMPFIEAGDVAAIGAIHTSKRRDDGRGSLTPSAIHQKGPFAIVASDKDLERYIRIKEKEVGILKSGYWWAAQKINAKVTMPAWVKNSLGAGFAIGEDKTAIPAAPEVTVGNLKGAKGIAGSSSFIRNIVNRRAYAMRALMAAKLNKEKIPLWLACAQGKTTGTSQFFS